MSEGGRDTSALICDDLSGNICSVLGYNSNVYVFNGGTLAMRDRPLGT